MLLKTIEMQMVVLNQDHKIHNIFLKMLYLGIKLGLEKLRFVYVIASVVSTMLLHQYLVIT